MSKENIKLIQRAVGANLDGTFTSINYTGSEPTNVETQPLTVRYDNF